MGLRSGLPSGRPSRLPLPMILYERPNGLRLFFALRGSILPRIAPSLLTCTLLAVVVTLSHGVLFQWKITLTPVPFSLIGLALAIFLGFRNSTAYDRYWEARGLWGQMVESSRTLARQWLSLVRPLDDSVPGRQRHGDFVRRCIAHAHLVRHQLRGSAPGVEVARLIGPEEAAAAQRLRLPSEALLRRNAELLGEALAQRRVAPALAAEIDRSLAALTHAHAGCERLRGTPIPFAYMLLLHRTAYLYCFLLPFGLIDQLGFMTPFVVAIVAYTFFGLDALGDEIEQPFGLSAHHLPLDALCRIIEIDLLEALGEPAPAPLQAVDGCLH